MLPMMRNQTMKSWRSAEQWLLGSMVLALAMAAFIWLVLGPAPAAPAHLTAVILLIASLLASLVMMHRVGTTRRQMEAVLHGRARAEQHATEALRHSEAQWKEVFEHNPVMYFMVDAAGTVLSVNTFGAAQLGYSVGELLGQSVLKVFPAEEQHAAQSNVAICLENVGQTHSWEICKVRKDGSSLWVRENAKAVRRLDNQLIVLIACEDVTECKEAENALRQSEMFLAEAQRLSHTGSFGWRVSTGEIRWSEETFRIFAYDRATKPTVELVLQRMHPEDAALVKQTIERASQDGKDFACEHRLLMPDGSVKYLQVVAHALEKDESGSLEFVGAVMDITERKRAEDSLCQAQAELAHVTRVTTLGELAASIAHEINQAPPHLEDAREALQCIIDDGQRASAIITRIRALLRNTAPEPTRLALAPLVHEVVRLTQPECVRQGVALHVEVAADLPAVVGDRVQVQQVLLNLVLNSLEALATVTERPREVWIRVQPEAADTVRVAVEDTGVGIAPELRDQIFTAFYTTKAQGLGMGLAISRSIVEQHGGRLWAVPHAGPGATVQFTLWTAPEAV